MHVTMLHARNFTSYVSIMLNAFFDVHYAPNYSTIIGSSLLEELILEDMASPLF